MTNNVCVGCGETLCESLVERIGSCERDFVSQNSTIRVPCRMFGERITKMWETWQGGRGASSGVLGELTGP